MPLAARGRRQAGRHRGAPGSLGAQQHRDRPAVRSSLRDGQSLFAADADLIAELRADLIVTQDLWAVCAVSSGDVATACPVDAEILSLDPRTLDDVADTVRHLASRLGAIEPGATIVHEIQEKLDAVRDAVRRTRPGFPTIRLALEPASPLAVPV